MTPRAFFAVFFASAGMLQPAHANRPQETQLRGSDAAHLTPNDRTVMEEDDSLFDGDDEDQPGKSDGTQVQTGESMQRTAPTAESQTQPPLMARVFRVDAELGALKVSIANLEVQLGVAASAEKKPEASSTVDSSEGTGTQVLGSVPKQAKVQDHDFGVAESSELDAISEARKHALDDMSTRVKELRSVIEGLKQRQTAIEKYLSKELAGSTGSKEENAKEGGLEGSVEGLETSVKQLWSRINSVNSVFYGTSAAQQDVPSPASL